jgi:anti-sigma regulatory factor (Ser/Thr protein kinase)
MKTAQTFAPDVNSIPAARRFVLAAIGAFTAEIGAFTAEQRDAVSVMVSELAMNAVEHARTRFQVTVQITHGSLLVEVTDSGGGTAAAQPLPDATSLRGRGLYIVDRLSDAWGTSSSAGAAKSVWFTIILDAAAGSAARRPASSTKAAPPAERPAGPPTRRRPDSPTRSPQYGHRVSPTDLLSPRGGQRISAR